MVFQVKASSFILGERYSGPPSKMFPLIRDLAEGDHFVKSVAVEMDLTTKRVIAVLEGISTGGTASGSLMYKGRVVGKREVAMRRTVPLSDILAIRVVRVITVLNDEEKRWNTDDYPFPERTPV